MGPAGSSQLPTREGNTLSPIGHRGSPGSPPTSPPASRSSPPCSNLVLEEGAKSLFTPMPGVGGRRGRGRKPRVGRGEPGLFRSRAPRFPLFQEGASSLPPSPPSLTPPLPPLSRRAAGVRGALSGPDCAPGRGVMGAPSKHSFGPVQPGTRGCARAHTPHARAHTRVHTHALLQPQA